MVKKHFRYFVPKSKNRKNTPLFFRKKRAYVVKTQLLSPWQKKVKKWKIQYYTKLLRKRKGLKAIATKRLLAQRTSKKKNKRSKYKSRYFYRRQTRLVRTFSKDPKPDYILHLRQRTFRRISRFVQAARRKLYRYTTFLPLNRTTKHYIQHWPKYNKTFQFIRSRARSTAISLYAAASPYKALHPIIFIQKARFLLLKEAYLRYRIQKDKQQQDTHAYVTTMLRQHKRQLILKKQQQKAKQIAKVVVHQSHRYIHKLNKRSKYKPVSIMVEHTPVGAENYLTQWVESQVNKKMYWSWEAQACIRGLFFASYRQYYPTTKKQTIARILWEDIKKLAKVQPTSLSIDLNMQYNRFSDTLYNSFWAGRFMNMFIRAGKKKTIFKLFLQFYAKVKYSFNQIPLLLLLETMEKLKPPFRLNRFIIRRTQELVQFPAMATETQKYSVVLKWLKKEVQKEAYQNIYWHKKSKRWRPKRVVRASIANQVYTKFHTFKLTPKRHPLTKLRSALLLICKEKFFMFRQKSLKRRMYQQTLKF